MSQELIDQMMSLRNEGKSEKEIAEALEITVTELRQLKNRHQAAVGKALRETAQKMASDEGKNNAEIASELGISEDLARRLLLPPGEQELPEGVSFEVVELPQETNMWWPGLDYQERGGNYAKSIADVSLVELTRLVKTRVEQDGEWTIKNKHVGDREELMRKMMAWASKDENIQQCVAQLVREGTEEDHTVDWVCRELAKAAKRIGKGVSG